MTFSQFALILQSRWRSALIVFAVVVGLVAALALYLPRKYTATGAVVLDVKSPDPIAGVVLPGMTVSGYMATQVDVLQSERVMLLAIRSMQLDKDPELRAVWQEATEGQGDFESWLSDGMLRRLDVKPGKDSNVILVSFSSTDPQLAAKTANAIVRAYIETTLELRTDPAKQFNSLFDESTKKLRDSLETAQARLSAFQQTKGLLATDERLDVENSRLTELSSQLVALQATASESGSRQSAAGTRSDQMQEVLTNPMVMQLGADLARSEARLNELGQRYGDQHPQVIELRANIKELRSRLNSEKARITGGITVNNNVNQSRLESLRASLEAQRIKVLKMKSLRDEAGVLQRDVENAQRVYDAGFTKLNQSTLESQATQTNVSVIKKASAPPFPSSPRVGLIVTVGTLLGIVLAFAFAVLREYRDRRLRTDADVIYALDQPLLGVLPDRSLGQISARSSSLRGVAERVLGRPALIGR